MKLFIYALIAFVAMNANAQDIIEYHGKHYAVVRAGRATKVIPIDIAGKLSILQANTRDSLDCENLKDVIEHGSYLLSDCRENPNMSMCKLFRKRLRLVSEGRVDAEIPIDPGFWNRWSIQSKPNEGSDSELAQLVAQRYLLNQQSVEVITQGQVATHAHDLVVSELVFAPDSLSGKIQEFLGLERAGILGVESNGNILTRNRFVACDILHGQARISLTAVGKWQYLDRIPREVLNKVWQIYQNLEANLPAVNSDADPVVAAAEIGFQIGIATMAAPALEDPVLSPRELFTRLFDRSQGFSKLKEVAGPESLHSKIYPDQLFNINLEHNWRLQ